MGAAYIRQVAAAALVRFDDVMNWLGLFGGKNQGKEYLPLNPKRGDHKPGSFTINRNTGAWMDGATGDKGGDLVSLTAWVWDMKQGAAAEQLGNNLGMTAPQKQRTGARTGAGDAKVSTPPSKPDGAVCVMPIPGDAPAAPKTHARHGWAYRAPDGAVMFYHCRFDPKQEGERKQFAPLTLWRNASGKLSWEWKAPPEPRPVFGLYELAARTDDPVCIVEGEKAADAAAQLLPHCVVMTWQGGAQAVDKADWQPLAGRVVWLWPDADEPGRKAMEKLAALLPGVGAHSVRMVNLALLERIPGADVSTPLAKGDDAADLLARGWTDEHLVQLVGNPDFLQPVTMQAEPETHTPPEAVAQDAPTPTQADENEAQIIARLAKLSPLEYDRVRVANAERLNVRPAALDAQVKLVRKEVATDDGISFADCEPWHDPIEPAGLLSELSETVRRFIVCSNETADAVALWAAMTWFIDVVQVAPLAVITAPEKRCGKSQLLFLLGRLSCRPLTASNISPAALFRVIDAWQPTLLVDEADAFMRENEELRGLLNCGHTRDSAYTVRIVGEAMTPTRFNVWGAKAIAGIGHLADTLMDRAVTLELRRKLEHETVERLRHAESGLFETLAAKLARFADDYREAVRVARPELPHSLNDRAQDNWEPLLAIAQVAGGVWLDRARHAALKLSGTESATVSAGTELLADIREVFEHKQVGKISTADLIRALCEDEEKCWATWNRGNQISPRQLARRLNEYGITSKTIRLGYDTAKGFELVQFKDSFARYLASPAENGILAVTPSQPNDNAGLSVTDNPSHSPSVTQSVTLEPLLHKACDGVTDKAIILAGSTATSESEVIF